MHGDEYGTERTARRRAKPEGAGEYLGEGGWQRLNVCHNQHEREHDIDDHHEGDDFFRHTRDALQPANDDQPDGKRQHKPAHDGGHGVVHAQKLHGVGAVGVEKSRNGAGDGVHLGESADAEQADAHAEEGEELCEPAPVFAHAALDVVERPAQHVPGLGVVAAKLHREQPFRVLRRHAEQRGQPHPKQRARPACDHGRGHANDVARADGGRQRRAQGGKARDLAFRAFLVFHHVAQRARELPELEAAQAQGEEYAACEDEDDERDTPHRIVDCRQDVVKSRKETVHLDKSSNRFARGAYSSTRKRPTA